MPGVNVVEVINAVSFCNSVRAETIPNANIDQVFTIANRVVIAAVALRCWCWRWRMMVGDINHGAIINEVRVHNMWIGHQQIMNGNAVVVGYEL